MGIKNLNKFLKDNSKNAFKSITMEDLRGSTIVIDSNIYCNKYSYFGHMFTSFIKQLTCFLKYDITPLYLFDGKPDKEKEYVLKKRRESKNKRDNEINELKVKIASLKDEIGAIESKDLINNLTSQIEMFEKELSKKLTCKIVVNWDDVKEFKKLLTACNIFHYNCDGENDIYIKDFLKFGFAEYAMTEDYDFLAHGCEKTIYNFNPSKLKDMRLCSLTNVLTDLELSMEQFVDLCIMMGCDYTSTIKKVGPKTAFKLIKKCKTLEGILEHIKGHKSYKPHEDFNYEAARKMFNIHYDLGITKSDIKLKNKLSMNNIKTTLKHHKVSEKCAKPFLKLLNDKHKNIKKTKNIFDLMKTKQ